MRQITASEVKPGMEVQWTHAGITRKCMGSVVESASLGHGVNLRTFEGGMVHIPKDVEVTVLSEPQPEEPIKFGARVVAAGRRFVLADDDAAPWMDTEFWMWRTWAEVCAIGPVTVIDADPSWTLPDNTDAPEVPEQIEEWPEDDTALRPYKWRDMDGDTWTWAKAEDKWECRSRADIRMGASRRPGSWFGPFTCVIDA